MEQPTVVGLMYKDYPLSSTEFMIFFAIAYNIVCFGFEAFMKNRPKLNVDSIAKMHNLFMSIFSGVMTILVLLQSWRDGRFSSHDSFHCHPPRSEFYAHLFYLFYLSKLLEIVDTFLLIASKKRVIWLHRLHHTSTPSVVVIVFHGSVGHDLLPFVENLIVHFFMYLYFYNPKKFYSFKILMTLSQIFQFIHVLGYCGLHILWYFQNGFLVCNDSLEALFYDTFWYVVYLVLFMNFFVQQYLKPKAPRKSD